MIGIYKITNPTNKIYIGQSRNIKSRWSTYRNYKCKGQPKLYNSLIKYGFEKHNLEILFTGDTSISQSNLNHWEKYYLDDFKSQGYEMLNIREAGSFGGHSEETKQKLSQYFKGKKRSITEEEKLRIRNRFAGKARSEETKRKISEANKGRPKLMLRDRPRSEETKRKIGAANKLKSYGLGEMASHSKLNDLDVKIIKEGLELGLEIKKMAIYFGVHPTTIGKIKSGKNWSHL